MESGKACASNESKIEAGVWQCSIFNPGPKKDDHPPRNGDPKTEVENWINKVYLVQNLFSRSDGSIYFSFLKFQALLGWGWFCFGIKLTKTPVSLSFFISTDWLQLSNVPVTITLSARSSAEYVSLVLEPIEDEDIIYVRKISVFVFMHCAKALFYDQQKYLPWLE